jgi:cytochrome c-type biogenesis protein
MSLESPETISFFIAFMAGFLSFVSPCVLPLVPSYVSYITGLSLGQLTDKSERQHIRWITLQNSLLFILGFTLVFIAFGASATYIGHLLLTYQQLIRKLGGILVVIFGLMIMGVFKIPFLMSYKQYQFKNRPVGAIGTVLVGVVFAAAWTPCVGPILGTILLYASTTHSVTSGIQLLLIYSIGLGLPLLVTSLAINTFLTSFQKIKDYLWIISMISGLFLIAIGIMIFTNSFTLLTAWLTKHGIGWYIGQ